MKPGLLLALAFFLLPGGFLTMTGCAGEQTPPAETTPAVEEAPPVAASDPIARGRASYEQYCMGCHGPEGKGNGENVGDLNVLPSDLTQLSSNNGGTFPVDKVVRVIDGSESVEAHGSREMPVWGNIWTDQEGEEAAKQRINELVEYLRSIQENE